MYAWLKDLFPLNRSLTGPGTRATLDYIKDLLPELVIESVPTGSHAFDWTIPSEWSVSEAWIKDEHGKKIVDFAVSNLHLMGYSEPIHTFLGRTELLKHLYSYPEQPDAIPYVTSYYERNWGFCLPHKDLLNLGDGPFEVMIDSNFSNEIKVEKANELNKEFKQLEKERQFLLTDKYATINKVVNNAFVINDSIESVMRSDNVETGETT
jgi:aminopeptidase-like protein